LNPNASKFHWESKTTQDEVVVVEFNSDEVVLLGAAKEGMQSDKMRVVIRLQNMLNNESRKEENALATKIDQVLMIS